MVAGASKLADCKGSREALVDFGVPSFLASPLGILLPLIELAAAAALIPAGTAWWGAVGALALLLMFVAGIGTNLALGRKPDCHCFGQLHSAPAGWKTLTRNGVLAVVAGFIVWQGRDGAGPSVVSWLGKLSATQSVALVAGLVVLRLFAVQWWFMVHLLRQNGRLLVRLEALEVMLGTGSGEAPSQNRAQRAAGLPVGTQAPSFSLPGLYGETLTLEALRASGKPVMLLFTDPGCGPCTALLPEIRRWQKEHAQEELTISLISRGSVEQNRAKSTEHGLREVLLQKEWEVAHAYEAYGTPSAVLVEPDGKIASPLAQGSDAIKALVARAAQERLPTQRPTQRPLMQPQPQGEPCPNCGKVHPTNGNGHPHPVMSQGTKVGEPAPPIELQDLKGNTVTLEDFKGEKTLVLFWNPECGFCQQMLPDLKDLENSSSKEASKILVVSAGTGEANKAMGLRSPVVLDPQFAVGRAFGAAGTPSAVLVDEEGRIASEVAIGAPAVLGLARASSRQTEKA